MNNKKDFFSTVFCIFIAVLFLFGCNNHLLKLQQEEAHLIVKIANSTGARNVSSETEYNVTAWIENRDGSQSHYQEISTKENNLILTFEDLVIGSQINIHLELIENDDTQTKLTGTSGWFPVKEGEQVIEIELKSMTNTDDSGGGNGSTSGGETEGDEPAIVDAETPVITQQPHGKSQTFEPNTATSVTTTLEIDASVGDGGDLTYQWYSNTSNSTSGGTLINGATDPSYTASTGAKSTTYYYCVITNTNNDVNGKTTASVTSHIAAISSIEGKLTSITAQYTGTGYQLVNTELNYDDIEIQQTYTAGSETQVVTVSVEEVKDQYTIVLQENTIGMVPATVIHTETKKETTVDIPVKYQLDASKLTITGNPSVEQNGTLSLTANYADASGSTITYQKYDGESSTIYNVKDNVTISWTGGATGSSWQANADTTSTGQQTATVTLTSTDDEWCVTTEGITASHEYEVIQLVNAKSPTITQEPKGQIQIFATGKTDSVKKILAVAAAVDDGGDLTYQWYSNTTNSTENGIQIENATNATYEAQVAAKETKYFYCVVTNTNDNVNGTKTASVTSDVVTVASIEGTLTGITAQYAGSQEYILVENSNFDGFTVTETYTGNEQTITNQVTSLDGQYNVTKPENAIGYVPVTITNSSKPEITTTIEIPVKYQLDESNLSITGNSSVNQNADLLLTANYADDSGSPITYQKYDGESSTTYNVKDNVTIAWTGGATGSSWQANADTTSTGQNTATVTLTSTDGEWCVTTGGVEKSHSYEVTEPAPSYDPTVGLSYDSSTNTLTIHNEAGLKNFRNIVNGDVTSGNITVGEKTYTAQDLEVNAILENNITLTEQWTPIARESYESYKGTFDGNKKSISELQISSTSTKPQGFFGVLGSGATVKNLTVKGNISSSYYAGGIAGYIDGATIEYCINEINITNNSAGKHTGGIAGYISSTQSTITGCVNFGAITGIDYVGGILGGSYTTNGATVDKCINLGAITIVSGGTGYSGGIYGYPATTNDIITNCLNLGSITSYTNKSAGIAWNQGVNMAIRYCLSVGDMSNTPEGTEGRQPLAYWIQSSDDSLNYYDSDKISSSSSSIEGTGRSTSVLKDASTWDNSWKENWSFDYGGYPIPNIQENILASTIATIVFEAQ